MDSPDSPTPLDSPVLSAEQQSALDDVATGRSILLTGPGGTGKTFTVNAILETVEPGGIRHTASTGIAASHIGGCTIHSYLSTGLAGTPKEGLHEIERLGTRRRDALERRFRDTSMLVIDEISMLSADYLDMTDAVLRFVLQSDAPFGGIQILACGDFLQLPPIIKGRKKGRRIFAFESDVWQAADLRTHVLTKSFRQSEQHLVDALNDLRAGIPSPNMVKVFESCVQRRLNDPTYLVGKNDTASGINTQRLTRLSLDTKAPIHTFDASLVGDPQWTDKLIKNVIAEKTLRLCAGTPVLMLNNDPDKRWVNGSRATVTRIEPNKWSNKQEVYFKLDGQDYEYIAARHAWTLQDGDGEIRAEFHQLPMKPAWALTIHKSQGMTLDNVCVHNRGTEIFADGQLYVALSRVRRLEGLSLTAPIFANQVKAHPTAVAFYKGEYKWTQKPLESSPGGSASQQPSSPSESSSPSSEATTDNQPLNW